MVRKFGEKNIWIMHYSYIFILVPLILLFVWLIMSFVCVRCGLIINLTGEVLIEK